MPRKSKEVRTNRIRDRFVAYIDICGFKKFIARANNDDAVNVAICVTSTLSAANCGNIQWAILNARGTRKDVQVRHKDKIRAFGFSDCIAISAIGTPEGFQLFLEKIVYTVIVLLAKGFVSRGAVTYGKLYHSDSVIFGTALNEAVEMEKDKAVYPRVILSKGLCRILTQPKYEKIPMHYVKDKKKQCFLDVFKYLFTEPKFKVWFHNARHKNSGGIVNAENIFADLKIILKQVKTRASKEKERKGIQWLCNRLDDTWACVRDYQKKVL